MNVIYHFTSSWHLEKIMQSGALTPTDHDPFDVKCVWGTSLPDGDDTAMVFHHMDGFKAGKFNLVRFSFPKRLFMSWQDFKDAGGTNRQLAWGDLFEWWEDVNDDFYEADPLTSWFVHPGPLSIRRALVIETRTYKGRWRKFTAPEARPCPGARHG